MKAGQDLTEVTLPTAEIHQADDVAVVKADASDGVAQDDHLVGLFLAHEPVKVADEGAGIDMLQKK